MAQPKEKLKIWRVLILRERARYLGTVKAPDERSSVAAAIAHFGLDEAQTAGGARATMTRAISDATWWRARAEEQRTIGEAMRHPSCRASSAEESEMAKRLEQGAAAPTVVGDLVERIIFELYNSSLYWILRERTPPLMARPRRRATHDRRGDAPPVLPRH